MQRANITISIECVGAKEYAEKIRKFTTDLFNDVQFRRGEEVEMTVSDNFVTNARDQGAQH